MMLTPRGATALEAVRLARRVERTESREVATVLLPYLLGVASGPDGMSGALRVAAQGLRDALESVPSARDAFAIQNLVNTLLPERPI